MRSLSAAFMPAVCPFCSYIEIASRTNSRAWTILQRLGLFTAGPVLDAFGVKPVLIAFAAIPTLMMSAAALACLQVRPRAASPALPAGSS